MHFLDWVERERLTVRLVHEWCTGQWQVELWKGTGWRLDHPSIPPDLMHKNATKALAAFTKLIAGKKLDATSIIGFPMGTYRAPKNLFYR